LVVAAARQTVIAGTRTGNRPLISRVLRIAAPTVIQRRNVPIAEALAFDEAVVGEEYVLAVGSNTDVPSAIEAVRAIDFALAEVHVGFGITVDIGVDIGVGVRVTIAALVRVSLEIEVGVQLDVTIELCTLRVGRSVPRRPAIGEDVARAQGEDEASQRELCAARAHCGTIPAERPKKEVTLHGLVDRHAKFPRGNHEEVWACVASTPGR